MTSLETVSGVCLARQSVIFSDHRTRAYLAATVPPSNSTPREPLRARHRPSPAAVPRPSVIPELLTQFAPLNAVLSVVERVALSEAPVLITGERGTGKTLLARAMHAASRRPGPLVEVDASALPPELFDIELFGFDEDGLPRKPGALEQAGQGTVLIDEIAALGHTSQTKLLNAMTRGHLPTADGAGRIAIVARILATTAHPLAMFTRDGRFSDALHERLRHAHIELPPLRERRTDIPLLAQQFVSQFGGLRTPRLSPEAIAVLEGYSWPGNVRELRTVIERAVTSAAGAEVSPRQLAALLAPSPEAGRPMRLADLERKHIEAVLRQTNWHRGRAAALLGISSKTLYRKIREYGFSRPTRDA
jgi:DNA-binding NtrC family response regulator